ncbi:MAG: hypothetical protein P4N59_10840 [Negativicutes bacterium]|nr:hypothetical protein [Negativicutes bacterium]
MGEFATYLWALLSRVFKLKEPDSDTKTWVSILGDFFDNLKQCIFTVRRSWLIKTSSGSSLELHGQARGIAPFPGENEKYYKRRVLMAFDTYSQGGTIPGLLQALSDLGYPNAQNYEWIKTRIFHNASRRYGDVSDHSGYNNRWSEFRVTVDIEADRQFTPADLAVLIQTIYKCKPAHTMPEALVINRSFIRFKHNGQFQYRSHHLRSPNSIELDPYYAVAQGQINLIIQE